MSVDWSNLKSGFDPGTPWDAFYLIRGKPGTGKTTFACGFPDSLLLDCDPAEGGKYVVNGRNKRRPVWSWDMLEQETNRLLLDAKENGDQRMFKRIIEDPAGQILTFCRERMKKKLAVEDIEGFDHGKVASLFRDHYLKLLKAGYYLIIIDHLVDVRMLQKGGSEKIVTEALLPQSITKYLEQDCHHVLTCQLDTGATEDVVDPKTKKVTKTLVKKFRITTKPGNRTSLANPKARVWLPEVIELPGVGDASVLADHFAKVWEDAVAQMRTKLTAG